MATGPTDHRRPYTSRDVARLLGLAQSTVSMALANDARISAETRAQVAEAAARLGYQPNRMARAMRTGRSHLLGVLVPSLRVSFFADLIDAIEGAASGAGYRCMLAQSRAAPAVFDREVDLLLAQQVDGLLLCPANPFAECAFSHRLPGLRLPTVLLDYSLPGGDAPCVVSDWNQIGQLAATHLLGLGHRRILCLQTVARQTTGRICISAAQGAIAAAGGAAIVVDSDETDSAFEPFTEVAYAALATDPRVSAVLVTDDRCAFATIRAATRLGRRVPEDLSVMSCAALDLGRWSTPAVTAIDQRPAHQGGEGMRLLLARLAGEAAGGTTLVDGVLLAGGTTAPVNVPD